MIGNNGELEGVQGSISLSESAAGLQALVDAWDMIHHYAYKSTLACDVYHYCQNNAVVDNCKRE